MKRKTNFDQCVSGAKRLCVKTSKNQIGRVKTSPSKSPDPFCDVLVFWILTFKSFEQNITSIFVFSCCRRFVGDHHRINDHILHVQAKKWENVGAQPIVINKQHS